MTFFDKQTIIFLGEIMDFSELEQLLFKLTDSEKRYLHQEYMDYSDTHFAFSQGEKQVFLFSLKNIIGQENNHTHYFIRKQSRFAPVPAHITDVIELNYVYHGESIQYINDKKVHLMEGDLILVDTEVSHQVDSADYNDIIISINIEQAFFKEHFLSHFKGQSALTKFLSQAISQSQSHNQYILFRSQNSQNLKLLFQQLLYEVYFPQLLDNDYKNHLLQLILLELIRSFSVEANGISDDSHKQQLTLEILAHINSYYNDLNLESCARFFGYNTSYFSTLVKESTGQTFMQLLQNKRLEASLPLLLHTKEPIRNISQEVGFSNLNHFYKLFKKSYGMTPAQYRDRTESLGD